MKRIVALLGVTLALSACGEEAERYDFDLPANFPEPRVPDDNPMSDAKVELGRHLFYDVRLSGNETQSCGSCHEQRLAFTEGLGQAEGSTGEIHPRGSMSLVNVAYAASLTWANPVVRHLEEQALVPMFGEEPVELGLVSQEQLLERLRDEPLYGPMFQDAWPDDAAPITLEHVTDAIASFQRTLISGNSSYDRYAMGNESAISDSAKRGAELFFSEDAECFHCHGGFTFSNAVDHANNVFDQATFQNNGLYNLDGRGAYPAENQGLFEFTSMPEDIGAFKPPTLRNIALTAPYMHDGSLATLDDVIAMYAAGGHVIESGPRAGDGRTNPNKSIFVNGFDLTPERAADLRAFLESLTDEEFISDPRFADPW
ncbi:MAG: MbnH family di-heme enzyme [Polyangiales bacterium]